MEIDYWIPIEDGLPEPGEYVLTFPHFKILPFGNIGSDKIGTKIDEMFWEYSETWEESIRACPYPTHWMRLPNPPTNK